MITRKVAIGLCGVIGVQEREVGKIKKSINEKERDEKRLNIIIIGMVTEGGQLQWAEKIQEMIRGKLGVELKIVSVRRSGRVLIVKLGREEEKRRIMENKYKLRGERIFIEQDMIWEDRVI